MKEKHIVVFLLDEPVDDRNKTKSKRLINSADECLDSTHKQHCTQHTADAHVEKRGSDTQYAHPFTQRDQRQLLSLEVVPDSLSGESTARNTRAIQQPGRE